MSARPPWKKWARTVLPCAVVAALTIALSAPAEAESLRTRDTAGDVERFVPDWDHPEQNPGPEAAPEQRNGDITGVRVEYGDRRVSVRLRFRELDHSEPDLDVAGLFRYPAHGQLEYVDVRIEVRNESWAGEVSTSRGFRCPVRHHLSYSRDWATISFPADCLGSPRWLQLNAVAATSDDFDHASYYFADRAPGTLRNERWTPRVHRG